MKQNTLTWSEMTQSGNASYKGVIFGLPAKPALSFAYDGLYYEDTIQLYFVGSQGIDLTQAQKDELDSYIFQTFNETSLKVHAYDSNNFYLGFVLPNTAGVAGTTRMGPPTVNERYRWDDTMKRWILIGGVDQNGLWLGMPVQMTDTRFYAEVDAAPPFPYYKWDFGSNSWVDGRTLEQVRAAARSALDVSAEQTRLNFITPGAGQAATYQLKADEADKYVSDPAPVAASYPLLNAEATATHVTIATLAATVRAQRDQWVQLAAGIEALRMGGKAAINSAADAGSVTTALQGVQVQLGQIGA